MTSDGRRIVRPLEEPRDGHFLKVYDVVVDDLMPVLTPAEFMVFIFLLRKTRGWRKTSDEVSIGQIARGTGLSDNTVRKALVGILKQELFTRIAPYDAPTRTAYTYRLNEACEITASCENSSSPPAEFEGGLPQNLREGYRNIDGRAIAEFAGNNRYPDQQISSINNSRGEEETLPDDLTDKCLLLLNQIKHFPKDDAANARKLAEWREEFPHADPREVCSDFKAYSEENPQKKPSRLRLRNFFKQAHRTAETYGRQQPRKPRSSDEGSTARRNVGDQTGGELWESPDQKAKRRAEAAARRREGYEWLFE
jgi:hypothetical protein